LYISSVRTYEIVVYSGDNFGYQTE